MRVIRGKRTLYWNDSVSRLNPCSSYINASVNKWSFGEVEDYDVTVTAPIPPPTLMGLNATGVHSRGATLNGIVNANGVSTTVTFEYGITPSYGNVAVASPSVITGHTNTAITNTRSNLMADTLYHYRIKAVAGGVTYYSVDATFRTQVPAGIANTFTEEELKVYPNPSTGIVHLEMPDAGSDISIEVVNVLGTTVFSTQEKGTGPKTISLSTLPAGLYEMHIQSGEKSTRKRIQILQ